MAVDPRLGYDEIREHAGHKIECVTYGDKTAPANAALECVDCGIVLIGYDRPMEDIQPPPVEIGDEIRLIQDVDRFPHFVAKKGATGVVSEVRTDLICVRMDEKIPGAEVWDNDLSWSEGQIQGIDREIEVISPESRESRS